MKANQKIVLSALAAGMLLFTGCGGGGGDTSGTAPAPTTLPDDTTPVVVAAVAYDGLGETDVEERHVADDASFTGLTPVFTGTQDTATLAADITGVVNLVKTSQYRITGEVRVRPGATLNIEPGTVIYGTGSDFMVVMKGAQIIADGTVDEPIIFTSLTALIDPSLAGTGQWGGLTILGDAPTNHTDPVYEVDSSEPDYAFGGTNDTDNSGILRNVQILNSGKVVGADVEINGLSLAGVGSGTVVENILVENSADDCIEIWGGTVNVTNATMVNCLDDSFDLDYGYTGTATNIRVQQKEVAHAGFEISSGGSLPMTSPTIINFSITKVAGSNEGGIYVKDETTAPTFINGLVKTSGTDVGIHTKKVFSVDQKAAIAFKDVTLNSEVGYDGLGETDVEERHVADDASFTGLTPVFTGTQDTATLAADITGVVNLVKTSQYRITGEVRVRPGATLNIEPGTVIYGTGSDFMVVMKGAQIIADGTVDEPIIFTSLTALIDPSLAGTGQWGGLTILGDAPTNHTDPVYEVDSSEPDYAFGGTNDTDNSGILRNVQILNSGKVVGADVEINGLSLAGVGSGTVVENILVENSADDCIEIWGGTVNVTNATMVNCLDDSFDLDYGYTGTATNIRVQQKEVAHAGFEISSGGSLPMTSPTIINFSITKVAGSNEGGIYVKDETTAPTFINGLVKTSGTDVGIHTKKVFSVDQKAAIAFKDVILK